MRQLGIHGKLCLVDAHGERWGPKSTRGWQQRADHGVGDEGRDSVDGPAALDDQDFVLFWGGECPENVTRLVDAQAGSKGPTLSQIARECRHADQPFVLDGLPE